jgi:hypothetical protein
MKVPFPVLLSRWGLAVLLLLSFPVTCFPDPTSGPLPPSEFVWRKETNKAFSVGEAIRYVVKYGFISAGHATMQISSVDNINGRPAYHILSKARTNNAMDVIFKVRDRNESWMDVESLCSLRNEQNLREGLYRRHNRTEYDHVRRRFHYWKRRKGKESTNEGDIPPFVQDVLSSLYYIRTRDLEVGKEFQLDANSGAKTWTLKVHVNKIETIRVPAGKFECFHIKPILAGDGIFQQKGELEVWMTTDARRIPVLLKSRVMVGAFNAEMTDYAPEGALAEIDPKGPEFSEPEEPDEPSP